MTANLEAEDWSYQPPDTPDPGLLDENSELFARLCIEVARRNLKERARRLDDARATMRRATDNVMRAKDEAEAAIRVLQDALWNLAEARQ